ncbi:MAG: carbon-nitrogen hydrolase family protein [Stellaceae bacterium]
MIDYPRFKAAAAHVAPIFHDTDRTIAKACDIVAEAAAGGARLVAFPESFVPGFPVWAGIVAPIYTHDLFKALAASAILVDGAELARVRDAARRHDIFVSLGFTEGTTASVGCLWNANILIGPDGGILNHHRKLVPTFYEKLVWANGDGGGLRVSETAIGRIGVLICGENTNPLARYALMAQGEQVHISTYPPVWPTRPADNHDKYDLEQAIRIRAGAHSFEAKAFNIVASAHYDGSMRAAMASLGPAALAVLDASPKAVSMVIDPTGSVIGEVQSGAEGIVYAEIDLRRCVEPKRFHDVVGGYNRFDIFKLSIDRSANRPIQFEDDRADARSDADRAATAGAQPDVTSTGTA